jgi:uncharacterized protein YhhL (DUF1145 family)
MDLSWLNKCIVDKFWFGFLLGMFTPWLTFVGYWLSVYGHLTFIQCIKLIVMGSYYTQLMSLCAIPIVGLFFGVLQFDKYRAGYGLIGAMLLYTVLNFSLK